MRFVTMALVFILGGLMTFKAKADTGQAITPIKNIIIYSSEIEKKGGRIRRKFKHFGGRGKRRR
jgi:hypothetical protein